jgi:hypothetical protein
MFVANKTSTDLNGYFGCKASYGSEDEVTACSKMFPSLFFLHPVKRHRYLVSLFSQDGSQSGRRSISPVNFQDPFAMHTDLLDQMILYYDVAVWRVRDPVREAEKVSV